MTILTEKVIVPKIQKYLATQPVVRAFDDATYQAGAAASISADLTLEQDAAHVNMGGNWRMPTKAEYQELINSSYTTQTWTDDYNSTGVAGYVITSKTNGNSIFLPDAGYCLNSSVYGQGSGGGYWSASWYDSGRAWYLDFDSWYVRVYNVYRFSGFSVRGGCE